MPRSLSPVAGALILGAVVVAPLAIGTVHSATRAVVFVACAAALGVVILDRVAWKRSLGVPVPALALAVAVAATALQLVPLPQAALAALSPSTDELLGTTLGDYGLHALSLDPPGTAAELAKLAAYLAFFVAAAAYLGRSHRRRWVIRVVAGVATLVAVLALLEQAVGARRVLFFYAPQDDWGGTFRGTFVNPNHFGALMCLGAPCALAIGLTEARLRVPAFLAVLVINVAAVLSFSRAALVFVPLAQVLTLVLDRQMLGSAGSPRWLFAGGIAAALALTVGLTLDAVLRRLGQSPELVAPFGAPFSKLHAWPEALRMAGDFPLLGVGRGAFEPVFTRYSDAAATLRITHIENGYLQALTDWGLAVTAALLGLAGVALVGAWRRLREDPLCVPAFAAIVALGLHELFDFAIELPGVALPALALLAMLAGRRSPDDGRLKVRARRWHLVAPALVVAALVGSLLVPSLATARARLTAEARDPAVATATVVADGECWRAAHPADYVISALVAERLVRAGNPEAMRWLNGAIYLNPSLATLHALAAEVLQRAGRHSQALLEWKTAAQSGNPAPIWARVAGLRGAGLDDLLAVTPPGLQMALGDWLVSVNRPADGTRVYEGAPVTVEVRRRLVLMALARGDAAGASTQVRELLQTDRSRESRQLAVRTLIAAGQLDDAARLLDQVLDREPDTFALELDLAQADVAAGHETDARARLDRLTWGHDIPSLVRLHQVRAELERRAGNAHQQQWELEQAARLLQ